MAIMDGGHDQELAHMNHLWSIISELSEQLSQNRSLAVSLYGQADVVNVRFELFLALPIMNYSDLDRVRLSMAKLDLCSEGMIVAWGSVDHSDVLDLDRFNLDKPKGLWHPLQVQI
jgi:hypothetical protein